MNARALPLSMVTLVFGALSIPLAFLRHLCVPSTIMALLAVSFHLWGRRLQARDTGYSAPSRRRSSIGFRLAVVGGACGLLMWVLWGTGALL